MAQTGKVFGARLVPVAGPCASVPLDSLWAAVSSMAAVAAVQKDRDGLARLTEARKPSMVALLKRSAQRPSVGPRSAGRCALN